MQEAHEYSTENKDLGPRIFEQMQVQNAFQKEELSEEKLFLFLHFKELSCSIWF